MLGSVSKSILCLLPLLGIIGIARVIAGVGDVAFLPTETDFYIKAFSDLQWNSQLITFVRNILKWFNDTFTFSNLMNENGFDVWGMLAKIGGITIIAPVAGLVLVFCVFCVGLSFLSYVLGLLFEVDGNPIMQNAVANAITSFAPLTTPLLGV